MDFAEKAHLMPQWVVMPQSAAMLADSLQRQHVALAVQQVEFAEKARLVAFFLGGVIDFLVHHEDLLVPVVLKSASPD